MSHPGRWWHTLEDGRIQCDLCPRFCRIPEGSRGLCFVRRNVGGEMELAAYGRASGFCVDPIEKKPLNHFYPGTAVLSFGTAGCNLMCKFCQNWDISKAKELDRLQETAGPEEIAEAALRTGCTSVAFTYNDPVIFAEYAIDVAAACRERGLKTVAVTAGYITPEARPEFFAAVDAANVDLKAFTEDFYKKLTHSELKPVLETLECLVHETDVWTEVTTLLIPGHNDSEAEIREQVVWIREHLGVEVPVHFSAFHPDYKMRDVPRTPVDTLVRARQLALDEGLRYVYTGNVHHAAGDTTYCPGCQAPVIERDWYDIGAYRLDAQGACEACGHRIAGHFGEAAGTWGRRRLPVHIGGMAI
jgi:pyruvate formate lyase activating enzyme